VKQLVKIIPLLGSDQPGEVVAAAAAIGRALTTAGRDWHWLAGTVNGTSASSPSNSLVNALKQLAVAEVDRRMLRSENGRLMASVGRLEARLTEAAVKILELQRKVVELSAARDNRPKVDAAAPLRDRPSTSQWAFRIGRMLSDDDLNDDLSDKSYEFLCSVRDQFRDNRPLSAKQVAWLEDLWERYKTVRTRTCKAS
jgi:hypothetical protein